MALTVTPITAPDTWTPCEGRYGNLWYEFDCASSSVTDFKYVMTVKTYNDYTGTTTSLATYKVPPRPTTGYGWFDAATPISTQLTYDFYPTTNGFQARHNSSTKVTLNYGFQYNPGLTFSDTVFESGYLGLTFAVPHNMVVGDIIVINKDNKTLDPSYDGTASVLAIVNSYEIKTSKSYLSATTLESGSIDSLLRITGTTSAVNAFNGTRQYTQVNTDFSDYVQNVTDAPFLTNYPFNQNTASTRHFKKVFSGSYDVLSFLHDGSANQLNVFKYAVDPYINPGASFSTATASLSSTYKRIDVGVGPGNLGLSGITFSATDKYYKITLSNGVPTGTSTRGTALYNIVDNCSPWTTTQMAFMNQLGGFDYMNFNWKSKNTLNTAKTEFKKQLVPGYSMGAREDSVLSSKSTDMWQASTEWITEKEANWLKELLISPEVYLVDLTGNNNNIPIIITDTSYEVKSHLMEKLFAFTVNYKYAFQIGSQGN